jgi:hypothetical protein
MKRKAIHMIDDLREWCEEGTLYVRCLKDIYDQEMKVCSSGEIYYVHDVLDIDGEILLSIDSEILGVVWCVSLDDDDFEMVYKESDY